MVATVEFRDLRGKLVTTYKMNMDEPRAYKILVSEHINKAFLGLYVFYFKSNEKLGSTILRCHVHGEGKR